jgi:hypothetical protein
LTVNASGKTKAIEGCSIGRADGAYFGIIIESCCCKACRHRTAKPEDLPLGPPPALKPPVTHTDWH